MGVEGIEYYNVTTQQPLRRCQLFTKSYSRNVELKFFFAKKAFLSEVCKKPKVFENFRIISTFVIPSTLKYFIRPFTSTRLSILISVPALSHEA